MISRADKNKPSCPVFNNSWTESAFRLLHVLFCKLESLSEPFNRKFSKIFCLAASYFNIFYPTMLTNSLPIWLNGYFLTLGGHTALKFQGALKCPEIALKLSFALKKPWNLDNCPGNALKFIYVLICQKMPWNPWKCPEIYKKNPPAAGFFRHLHLKL